MQFRNGGYALLELLLTALLLAILLTLTMPSLSATLARHRQHAELSALFHAFHHARKESIMRRRVVSLCPSNDGQTCGESADWSSGWLMFENADRDSPPRRDPGEILLLSHRVDPTLRIAANRRGFTLRATDQRATNGTLVVCDRARRIRARALVVSYTGRPRVTLEDRRGRSYACAD